MVNTVGCQCDGLVIVVCFYTLDYHKTSGLLFLCSNIQSRQVYMRKEVSMIKLHLSTLEQRTGQQNHLIIACWQQYNVYNIERVIERSLTTLYQLFTLISATKQFNFLTCMLYKKIYQVYWLRLFCFSLAVSLHFVMPL